MVLFGLASDAFEVGVGDRRRTHHRAEDFLADDLHFRVGVGDQGRLHEIITVVRALFAPGYDLGAFLDARIKAQAG